MKGANMELCCATEIEKKDRYFAGFHVQTSVLHVLHSHRHQGSKGNPERMTAWERNSSDVEWRAARES